MIILLSIIGVSLLTAGIIGALLTYDNDYYIYEEDIDDV